MRYSLTSLLLLSTLALAACDPDPEPPIVAESEAATVQPQSLTEPIDPQTDPVAAVKAKEQTMSNNVDLPALRAEVMQMIGEARADDVQQCRVVGFGHKACGGPAQYVAVSVKDGNEDEIMAKIAEYNAAEKAENERLGRMSDCAVVPKPSVKLQDGQCVLDKNSSGDVF